MDQLIAAAVRQGFAVWQTKQGSWVFRKGTLTVTERNTPATAVQWVRLLATLRGIGLAFPDPHPDDKES